MRNIVGSWSAGALVLAAMMAIPGASLAGPLVNFEDFDSGDDVTGAGTVYPSLIIEPANGTDAVEAVVTGILPKIFGAPNGPSNIANNCLEDADGIRVDLNDLPTEHETAVGFANITANGATRYQEFDFTFVDNVTVSDFSIRVFDFGDFNPDQADNHGISLTAKDGGGTVLATYVFNFTTPGGGTLTLEGDACDANGPNASEPGYLELSVSTPTGASLIELRETGGVDPLHAFDSIDFTACTRTIGYWKNHTWDGVTADINGDMVDESEGRSLIVDEKPGDGYLWQARGKNFSMLYAQLIAAKLNCGGSGDCTADGSITDAEVFLSGEGIGEGSFDFPFSSKGQKRTAAQLSSALDSFNNGFECVAAAQ